MDIGYICLLVCTFYFIHFHKFINYKQLTKILPWAISANQLKFIDVDTFEKKAAVKILIPEDCSNTAQLNQLK